MKRAVVFDLDDTLISELQYVKSGFRHIAKVLSAEADINEENVFNNLMSLFKKDPANVFNRFYEKHGIKYSKAMIVRLIREYRGHLPVIQLYNDVVPCVNVLRQADIKTGIITDGFANAQRQKLKAVEAEKLFDEIIITDEIGRDYWKPHPKPYELMSEKLGVPFEKMIYIGDNPEKDFFIGSIYPITTGRITRENGVHSQRDYYLSVKENFLITSLTDVLSYI